MREGAYLHTQGAAWTRRRQNASMVRDLVVQQRAKTLLPLVILGNKPIPDDS